MKLNLRKFPDLKASQIVCAMVQGIKDHETRSGFQIDMGTYGAEYQGLCFGCAATLCIETLYDYKFTADDYHIVPLAHARINPWQCHAAALEEEEKDMRLIETAVDCLRRGDWGSFENLLDIVTVYDWDERLPQLRDENCVEDCDEYLKYAKHLEDQGL